MSFWIGFEKRAEEEPRKSWKTHAAVGLAGAALGGVAASRLLKSERVQKGFRNKLLGKAFGFAEAKPLHAKLQYQTHVGANHELFVRDLLSKKEVPISNWSRALTHLGLAPAHAKRVHSFNDSSLPRTLKHKGEFSTVFGGRLYNSGSKYDPRDSGMRAVVKWDKKPAPATIQRMWSKLESEGPHLRNR